MTLVRRSDVLRALVGGVDVDVLAARAGGDAAAKDAIAAADLDNDGRVAGFREARALWNVVDRFARAPARSTTPAPTTTTATPTATTTTPATPTTTTTTTTPAVLARARIEEARSGGLSGDELIAAHAEIAIVYGDDVADRVMRESLGFALSSLDASGVDWVKRHTGTMNGQIDRYQAALRTHLKDAHLIDVDGDGRLSDGDVAWRTDAAGRVNITKLDRALRDRVQIGAAMIGAAEAMDGAGHRFALIVDHKFNPHFWTPDGTGTFKLKDGVKASDAFDDLFKSPHQYQFECATALVITQYKAMRDLLGADDFDRVCNDLRIGPWQNEDLLDDVVELSGRGDVEATAARKETLRAGDYGYFKNWEVSEKGAADGWQGENVIYLGDGRFYGHPFGIADEKTIVDHLNTQRVEGSTKSASFLDLRSQLSSRLLREDRVVEAPRS
jgi:protein-glutamine gamma-glutamyltransferase